MWTPVLMFTTFPNAECLKALLRAVEGAEAYYCGSAAHQPWVIMDGARELMKAVCETKNNCSVGATLCKIRAAIERGERPAEKLTCPTRDKFHITAATKRWASTSSMIVAPDGPSRAFFTRFLFKVVLWLWDAGRAAARPAELKGVPLTAAEHVAALQQADAHMRLALHLTSAAELPLINGTVPFCPAAVLLPLSSVDTLTGDDANGDESNYDGLSAGVFEALNQDDAAPPPPVEPGVEKGEFYERCFRLNFPEKRQMRIYLLKERSENKEQPLRWLIKAGVDKDVPPEELHVGGIDVSLIIETSADVLARLDAGEDVALPNPFKSDSLYEYMRRHKFPLALTTSFLIPGRPEDLSHSNIGEGRMAMLKRAEGLLGRPVQECVLKLTGNKAGRTEEEKQGFMPLDTKRFSLSALLSPKEAADAVPGAADKARHELKGFSESNIAMLDALVKAIRSTTQQKALDALRAIHAELHTLLKDAAMDFDDMKLKTTDMGSIASRTWLPMIKGKRAGKAKGFVNDAQAQRLMDTLDVFGKRANDVVHFSITKKEGLVRVAGDPSAAAGGSDAPPPAPAPLAPVAMPLPPPPLEAEEEEEAAEKEAEEDSNEPLPAPPPPPQQRPPRCPWQPLGGAPCLSGQDASCDHGACGGSHCGLLRSKRGYPPCSLHRAPAG